MTTMWGAPLHKRWRGSRLRDPRQAKFLTLDSLRMAKHRMFYSSAKAERELDYRARPYGEALCDALAWFRSQGMVR